MKRIVAISDTHNRHKQIKALQEDVNFDPPKVALGGDIIIHTGDATGRGESGEVESFLKWYGSLDFSYRIFTPGNHDFLFERDPTRAKEMCKKYGVTLLIDEGIIIDDIKVWGSPYSPEFHNWAFNRARNLNEAMFKQIPEIKPHWDKIPADIDILVTHCPPYGILDEVLPPNSVSTGQFLGCQELLEAVNRVQPDLHFFGHIHSSHGNKHINGTSFYNVSICDERYYPSNQVTVVDYDKE